LQRHFIGFQVVSEALVFNETQRLLANKFQSKSHKGKCKQVVDSSKAKMAEVSYDLVDCSSFRRDKLQRIPAFHTYSMLLLQGVLFVDAQVVQESSPEGKVYCARQGREASHARGTEEEGAGELEVGPCVLLTHLRNVIRNCMLPM
jgi:hypothetical protein